ncbi:MAG: flagellar biosynthesis protein FlhA [Pseudomonadota bacterium]|nr:flagellar biosynthesis protein FlhA [Pseudomonadota bacterium]
MATANLSDYRQIFMRFDPSALGIPALVLLILSMLILPFPPFLLDILFTFNIILGLVILVVAINTYKPLEFSAFPATLLLATMLRLGLNVASTRVVLVNGHEGTDAAGKVIAAFGEFVISGNYLVGFIVFGILMIINFIVVTKGAGRVSEVIARFTLDALPGKQMAIDADLSAGIIDQETAKARREEISQESDFFGSMDGASKFVRGDAVAGLLILIINIIGGLAIGMFQHDLSLGDAGRIYVLLTIGDGLVAQIPSLLLSLATAIVVTRVTTSQSMSEQAAVQLANPTALYVGAAILTVLGMVPGMPHLVFLMLAGGAAALALALQRKAQSVAFEATEAEQERQAKPSTKELDWDDLDTVDLIGLEVGYGLVPLVDSDAGGQLMTRVRGVRKKLSAELGFLVHPVRIRDNLDLGPNEYHIILKGVVRAKGEVRPNRELAIDPGHTHGQIEGIPTREPAFGLDALWIEPSQRDYARTLGYTVVDASTAIATHLNALLRQNASELLSHDESQQLLDKLAERAPKLVEDLVPDRLPLGAITRVLQQLLAEGVPVKDMRTIVEALSEAVERTQDPDQLTALVRPRIGRMIMQPLLDEQAQLNVLTLEPEFEQLLHSILQQSNDLQTLAIDPKLAEGLFRSLRTAFAEAEAENIAPALVVSPPVRPWLARVLRHRLPDLPVLAYSEIPDDTAIKVVGTVDAQRTE